MRVPQGEKYIVYAGKPLSLPHKLEFAQLTFLKHPHLLPFICGCFYTAMAEVGGQDRDPMDYKTSNVYYLVLYK